MKRLQYSVSRVAVALALSVTLVSCSQLGTTVNPAPLQPTAVNIAASRADLANLKPLSLSDIMQFREIKERAVSDNQQWLLYTAQPDFGDSTGYVRHLLSEREFSVERADRGQLNQNGSFALFRQQAPLLAREQAKNDKAKRDALAQNAILLNTATGEQQVFANIERFSFTGAGNYALLLARKADSKDSSQLLKLLDLQSGEVSDLGQVTEFAIAKDSDLIALVVEPAVIEQTASDKKAKNANPNQQVLVYFPAEQRSVALTEANTDVKQQLRFSPDGQQLVFFSAAKAETGQESAQQLWHWSAKNLASSDKNPARRLTVAQEGWLLSEKQAPEWRDDGQAILLGFRPLVARVAEVAALETDEQLFDLTRLAAGRKLQVWHGQDPRIIPQQKAEYQQAQRRTAQALLWLDNSGLESGAEPRLVPLSADIEDRLYPSQNPQAALLSNGRPYLQQLTWQGRLHDVWHVNLHTGQRQQVFAGNPSYERAHLSPSGRYALYQQQGKLWLFDSTDGSKRQLAADLKVSWVDEKHDRPEPAAAYGVAGWLADESAVLVYDRFDIWQLGLNGDNRNLTVNGRDTHWRYRFEQTDTKAQAIAVNSSLLLQGFNEQSKQSGFYQLDLATGELQTLISGNQRYDFVEALEQQNAYLFTAQSFRQFPDLMLAKPDFSELTQLTNVNPQQRHFVWGDSHLIDWFTADGERLQGVVLTPDGFDPTKRYPVLVYYYEQFSDRLFNYNQMRVNHRPNFPFYLGQDYVVFLPDIRFREGAPGPSATESLLPAIDRLIELGIADPKAIGLHGHSWSGYQTAFVITETDRFAAAVAGAPVANMTSAYSGIRWQTGLARQFQYETGQSRIGESMFDNLKPYIDNSPVFFADRINTPLLIQFGDKDGAVPWEQGIELYLALRRLDKDVVMLQYEGEDHHLADFANKVDYSIKMLEFFNHYLKGEPAPLWWQQGQPYQVNK
jgi:dipeptidyl aminopeptidase/acylaminoacyl peptidase